MLMLATLNAALPPILSGDVVTTAGGILRIKRNGAILFTVDLRPVSTPLVGFVFGWSINANQVIWEKIMDNAIVRTLGPVTRNPDGSFHVEFTQAGVGGRDFQSLERMDIDTANVENDGAVAENMLIRAMLRRSPDGTNFGAFQGAKVSIDTSAAEPVTFTFPPGIQ